MRDGENTRRRIARRLLLASASLAGACALALIADHATATLRSPAGERRVDELVQQVKTTPEVANELHGERERQTEASLERQGRSRWLAWTLLLSAGLFVASGKWYMNLRPQRMPSLDDLVAVRFAAAASAIGKPRPGAGEVVADENHIDLFVDELIARIGHGREAAIPLLQAIQTHYRYLPDEALQRVCERTEITPAEIAGTSSFYAQFRRSPVGRHVVRVCHGTACHVAGADQITQELRRHLKIAPHEDTDAERRFTLDVVACVGCCSLAPVMMIEQETAGRLTPARARRTLDDLVAPR